MGKLWTLYPNDTYDVVDVFTTRGGKWDAGRGLEYDIPAAMLAKYGNAGFAGAGADHHIVVQAPIGSVVEFNTEAGNQLVKLNAEAKDNGFVNLGITHDSAYNPDAGRRGPWRVWVNGVLIADGIGLPKGEHVSTYLIVNYKAIVVIPVPGGVVVVPDGTVVTPAPVSPIIIYQMTKLTFDSVGTQLSAEIVWQS